jgi:hypothetical protein
MTCRLCVPVSTQLPLVILVCSCGGFLCTLREPMVSHELSCSSLLFPVKLNLPFTSSYSNSSTNLLHCASSSALSDTASYFNYEWQSVGQCLFVLGTHLRSITRSSLHCILPFDSCGCIKVGHPLWWEDGSIIYSCNSKSVLGQSPSELVTMIFCLVEGPATCRARSLYLFLPGTGFDATLTDYSLYRLCRDHTENATPKVLLRVQLLQQLPSNSYCLQSHCLVTASQSAVVYRITIW